MMCGMYAYMHSRLHALASYSHCYYLYVFDHQVKSRSQHQAQGARGALLPVSRVGKWSAFCQRVLIHCIPEA